VFREGLLLLPENGMILERLGRVYLRYCDLVPAAVQCLFRAIQLNAYNHVAWYLLGRCYIVTSHYKDACEAYHKSISINPNNAHVWCSISVMYYTFGQYREALGMLTKALKLNPAMADAWYNIGVLYDMCGQKDDAALAYAQAREYGLAERFIQAGLGESPYFEGTAKTGQTELPDSGTGAGTVETTVVVAEGDGETEASSSQIPMRRVMRQDTQRTREEAVKCQASLDKIKRVLESSSSSSSSSSALPPPPP
jgi:tetratricopeptide (TPR) repeat protein